MLKVALDAGHYLYTPGKRCLESLDPNETREWTLNSRIADKVQAILRDYDCETLRVDDTTGQNFIDLDERAAASNKWGAEVYISIHHNAGAKGTAAGGTVVYWYSSVKERERQAAGLYNAVVNRTALRGNRAEPIQAKGYAILRYVNAPAFLLENGFMDSKTDTPIILTEEHAEKTAWGIVDYLSEWWGLVRVRDPEIPEIPDEKEEETDMDYEKFKEFMARYEAERLDLPPADWSAESRKWAEENGVIRGIGGGKMAYQAPLTREQYVEMEYRQKQ